MASDFAKKHQPLRLLVGGFLRETAPAPVQVYPLSFYRTIPYIRTSLKTVPQRLLSYDPSSTMEAGPMTGDFFPPCSTTESAVLQFLFSWDSAYVPSCQTWSSSPAQARESCAFLLSVYTDFWAFSEIYSAGCGGGSSRRISFFYFRTVRFCLCIASKF